MLRSIESWNPNGTHQGGSAAERSYGSMPFTDYIVRFWLKLRRSNNARATFWLAYNALWFFWNVTVAFIWNATTTRNSFGLQRAINESDHGMAVTDLEMSFIMAPFFLKPFVAFWQLVVAAQGFSWLFWFISLFCSVVYFVASLREETVGAFQNARETFSRRTINDAPDQPSGRSSAHPSAGVGGETIGSFLKNRARFAAEDLFWEGLQKGWRALRGG